MKLDYVEVCGFRGFRDKVRVQFGRGFTVISGRNGVGKSTICDAIEFAITGSIDKYAIEKSAKETLADYLWWRGQGTPSAHYVTLAFITDNGRPFNVTRTREAGADRKPDEIQAALCSIPAPENALKQLARTSIIRDEWIAALSLDLTETERFELVRSALGALEGKDLGIKAKEIVTAAEAAHSRNENAYDSARSRLSDRIVQQSEAQSALARSGDINTALQSVIAATPQSSGDLIGRVSAGRHALVDRRTRLDRMEEVLKMSREITAAHEIFNSPEELSKREAAASALSSARRIVEEAQTSVNDAERSLAREEQTDAIATSLTILVEHGERLGLHDNHCPLCAASRTEDEFAVGLEAARRRIASLSSGVLAARDALTAAKLNLQKRSSELQAAESKSAELERQELDLIARDTALVDFCKRHGLDLELITNLGGLENDIEQERGRLINLERALMVLDASQSVSRISSIETSISALRADMNKLAEAVSRSQSALASAREIERSVKRVSAEIIDERLAEISPLLNELYQRLRPHADWTTIDYSIRGDVRRFLSLRVGDGLNPQFVFSSGQRRAAGLAFLLSVHLARAWTPLHTLILDDPVQHIDDFRALQLVEVLAALRVDGRQIICAVEDSALADLLCRRLLSTPTETGRRFDFDLGPQGSTNVVTERDIPPMSVDVLRRSVGLQVVGGT